MLQEKKAKKNRVKRMTILQLFLLKKSSINLYLT